MHHMFVSEVRMKNRYTMINSGLSDGSKLKIGNMFNRLLCEGIILSLRDSGHICEMEYRRARITVDQKFGEKRK